MSMTANKQGLRKLAKVLSGKEWVAFTHKASKTFAVGTLGHKRGEDIVKWTGFDGQDNAEAKAKFIAAASPATVIALLDELEAAEKRFAELIHIISMHTVELGFGEKPITMAELIITREGSCSDVLTAIRAAGISVKGE